MCVAIIKKENISLPSKETLKICYSNNPHGAGFAVQNGKDVNVFKGYFDFEKFYEDLIKKVKDTDNCLIHFRYATHGSQNETNCHPFLLKRDSNTFAALVHNGVINNGLKNEEYSDSFWLTRQIESGKKLNNDMFIATNNKVAIINFDGSIEIYGNWLDVDGILFSNGTYRKDCKEESQKFKKELILCDSCGELGENYIGTDVGYHFCPNCLESKKVNLYKCNGCSTSTTNFYCNSCNHAGLKSSIFL